MAYFIELDEFIGKLITHLQMEGLASIGNDINKPLGAAYRIALDHNMKIVFEFDELISQFIKIASSNFLINKDRNITVKRSVYNSEPEFVEMAKAYILNTQAKK